MELEWDEAKAAVNLARHGITFAEAQKVFDDPFRVEFNDHRYDHSATRTIVIGAAADCLIAVVYCMRGNRVRLISARAATQRERRAYREAPYEY